VQILVTGRHVQVSDEIREYVQTKAGRLPRFYDRIHEIEVVLNHESDEQFSAEMIVRAGKKHTFVAADTGPDTFALIDRITNRLERQLVRLKERRRNHKHDARVEGGEAAV
jgi:putative sigma-54 modulation protein